MMSHSKPLRRPPLADTAAVSHGHGTGTGLSDNKLLMWVFLGSECLLFGGLISTYLIYRSRFGDGPAPGDIFDIPFTSVSSFVLLMSCLLYTSPSPRDGLLSRMPSSA